MINRESRMIILIDTMVQNNRKDNDNNNNVQVHEQIQYCKLLKPHTHSSNIFTAIPGIITKRQTTRKRHRIHNKDTKWKHVI